MSQEVDAFAHSLRRLIERHPFEDAWRPGAPVDDHDPDFSTALGGLGWSELAEADEDALPFIGSGALELGRAATPFSDVLSLLGGSPEAGGLAMYGSSCGSIAVPGRSGYTLARITESEPVNFADSLGVHQVTRTDEAEPAGDRSSIRIALWEAGAVGYLAGLTEGSVSLALEHARGRQVFGKTLAQIETVQQRLADAATTSQALVLSARAGAHGLPALAHASATVGSVMTHCHQVFGAIGFTLEFPMQRYSRRAKALTAFTHGWIDQCLEATA